MYHIFVTISLILSQDLLKKESINHLAQNKYPNLEEEKLVQEEQLEAPKEIIDKEVNELEEFSTASSENINSDKDLLDSLRDDEKERERKLAEISKKDIESLETNIVEDSDFGSIDSSKKEIQDANSEEEFSTITSDKELENKDKKETNLQQEDKKDPVLNNKENIDQNKTEIAIDKEREEEKKLNLSKNKELEKNPLKEENKDSQIEISKNDLDKDKKKDLPIDIKDLQTPSDKTVNKDLTDSAKDEGIIETISDSIVKVTNTISDALGIKDEDKTTASDNEKESPKEIIDQAKLNKEEKRKAKIKKAQEIKKERERIKRERKLKIMKERENEKQKKLTKLRKEYLEVFAKNLEGEVNKNYIIPEKKVLPKFINYPTPIELIESPKSFENRHHPNLITREENIRLMFEAIAQNRIDDFRALYHITPNPNLRNSYGDTLLIFAILMQKHDALTFILSNGANPNLKNKLGYTPLYIAIEMQDYVSVELLTNMGADINYIDGFGANYLMQAVKVGYFPIIDYLVEKKVDVNNIDDSGFTTLDIAYRDKKEIIVKYLKLNGAKTWIKKDYKRKKSLIEQLEGRWK